MTNIVLHLFNSDTKQIKAPHDLSRNRLQYINGKYFVNQV